MNLLPATLEQSAIRSILHQRVLESVLGIGRRAAPEYQFGGHELRQGAIELLLRHCRHSTDKFIRKRTAERGADLSHLSCRSEAIQAR